MNDDENDLLVTEMAARHCKVSRATFIGWRKCEKYRLPVPERIGRGDFWRRGDLDDYMRNRYGGRRLITTRTVNGSVCAVSSAPAPAKAPKSTPLPPVKPADLDPADWIMHPAAPGEFGPAQMPWPPEEGNEENLALAIALARGAATRQADGSPPDPEVWTSFWIVFRSAPYRLGAITFFKRFKDRFMRELPFLERNMHDGTNPPEMFERWKWVRAVVLGEIDPHDDEDSSEPDGGDDLDDMLRRLTP
ncbi:hypothetical protein [Methylocella sp.]|uniref:helix-turn-helix transcriptional regulator n=1 Tax=Methylocella sp. TaxID=1978226 RepID=UPI0035B18541